MATIPYNYICVEGNIGTGKTSLCKRFEYDLNCKLVLERFTENPFLPYFYEEPEKYAFPLELFFMTERYKQMQSDFGQRELFKDVIVSDYAFIKTLLFAGVNLPEDEYRIFQQLYSTLQQNLPKPEILLYLHRNPDELMVQIKKRGRDFEKNIQESYLKKIQDAYFNYFRTEIGFPIVILNMGEVNFLTDDLKYDEIIRTLEKDYTVGIHQVSLLP